jgi:hypothetical protein
VNSKEPIMADDLIMDNILLRTDKQLRSIDTIRYPCSRISRDSTNWLYKRLSGKNRTWRIRRSATIRLGHPRRWTWTKTTVALLLQRLAWRTTARVHKLRTPNQNTISILAEVLDHHNVSYHAHSNNRRAAKPVEEFKRTKIPTEK